MELRWTEEAAADLEQITDYLFQNAPERAAELVTQVPPFGLAAFDDPTTAVIPAQAGIQREVNGPPLSRG